MWKPILRSPPTPTSDCCQRNKISIFVDTFGWGADKSSQNDVFILARCGVTEELHGTMQFRCRGGMNSNDFVIIFSYQTISEYL